MKNIISLSTSLLLISFFLSCDDFIEKDISKKNVMILSPPDGYVTNSLTQTFWWQEIDGAEQYNLQVVRPNFSSVQQLVLDTTTSGNKFNYSFLPGIYQWRIRAINNGSVTAYSVHSFRIDSTLDLSTQIITLNSPVDFFVTNDSDITFTWSSLYNATQYRFQLLDSNGVSVLLDSLTANQTLGLILSEGSNQWQVRAENNISVSPFTTRIISIDQTAPIEPTPVLPVNGDTTANPVSLSWESDISSVGDSVLIFSDSLLNNLSASAYTANSTYSFNASLINKFYYWRLKSIDSAGNQSGYSSTFKFYVQ